MNKDLVLIKKKFGENMAKLCRTMFPSLLETEGLLSTLLIDHFDAQHFLYDDIINNNLEEEFKDYIYSFVDVENNNKLITTKTPSELLDEAGYILYECKTEEDIQRFKKYYSFGEELCTFYGGRLNRCYVFFAVKKNVDTINRSDFKKPKRQDEYGTSVISIQFTRDDSHTLSIKNRYNHVVNNPDSTFSNNLDNIIPGLTYSFGKFYNLYQLNSHNSFDFPGYVRANDGKFYKYNYEMFNIYYCPNNIIIDNFEVKKLNKDDNILLDYFILDLKNKKISLYDSFYEDAFPDSIHDIENISIINKDKVKKITINQKEGNEVIILLNQMNQIVVLKNNHIEEVGDSFLSENTSLCELKLPNLTKVGDSFLSENTSLCELKLPNLTKVGNDFLFENTSLCELELPNLTKAGNDFLAENTSLCELELPNLTKAGDYFLSENTSLCELELPNLTKAGDYFLSENTSLYELKLPNLTKVGDDFLSKNTSLCKLELPNLTKVGDDFLQKNNSLSKLELPNLIEAGDSFLSENTSLCELKLPNLTKVGNDFLAENTSLCELKLPNLTKAGNDFLFENTSLCELELPNLTKAGNDFLFENTSLCELELPNLTKAGDYFLSKNTSLCKLELPKLKVVGEDFLSFNKLEEVKKVIDFLYDKNEANVDINASPDISFSVEDYTPVFNNQNEGKKM